MNDELLKALEAYFAQFAEDDDEALMELLLPILSEAAKEGASGAALPDGVSVDWALVNENAVAWAKKYAAQLVTKINESTKQLLADAISKHLSTPGSTLGDLQKEIQGVMTASDGRARLIAQTEITRSYAEGNLATWKESGAIEKKRWRTNNDSKVCEICAPLNGKVIGLDESFGEDVFGEEMDGPPAHPGCRCWVTPVVEVGDE